MCRFFFGRDPVVGQRRGVVRVAAPGQAKDELDEAELRLPERSSALDGVGELRSLPKDPGFCVDGELEASAKLRGSVRLALEDRLEGGVLGKPGDEGRELGEEAADSFTRIADSPLWQRSSSAGVLQSFTRIADSPL
jgi:hypothetical protein